MSLPCLKTSPHPDLLPVRWGPSLKCWPPMFLKSSSATLRERPSDLRNCAATSFLSFATRRRLPREFAGDCETASICARKKATGESSGAFPCSPFCLQPSMMIAATYEAFCFLSRRPHSFSCFACDLLVEQSPKSIRNQAAPHITSPKPGVLKKSQQSDSNRRPTVYKTVALPLCYAGETSQGRWQDDVAQAEKRRPHGVCFFKNTKRRGRGMSFTKRFPARAASMRGLILLWGGGRCLVPSKEPGFPTPLFRPGACSPLP